MPIFELDDGRPRLVQPMQPLPGSFGQDCAALLAHHLAAVAGEPLFVVRPRATTHEHADVPEMLALDPTGRPVIVEVVPVVDDDAVVATLRHAGAAARMTTTDLARAYHPDPSRFPVDFAAFREQVAFGATTSRREGVRLILLCSEVAAEAGDTLGFLRGPGRHVDVLQVGVVRGVDDRRMIDVSPLATHETVRRSVEPTALRLVRSSEAFATAMAYDSGRVNVSRPPMPGAAATPPRRVSSPDAITPVTGLRVGLDAHPPAAPTAPDPLGPVAPLAPLAPVALAGSVAGQPRATSGDAHPQGVDTTPHGPGATPHGLTTVGTHGSAPTNADGAVPNGYGATPSGGSGGPGGPAHGAGPIAGSFVPTASPAAHLPAVSGGPRPLTPPAGALAAPSQATLAPTPAVPGSPASPGAPGAPAPASAYADALLGAGTAAGRADVVHAEPAGAVAAPQDEVRSASRTSSADVDGSAVEQDAGIPFPELATLAKRRRAVTTVVWYRERRNQRLVALLRHDGLIQLPDGRVYADPDLAAAAAAGSLARIDGWRSWRMGDGGPTLAEAAGVPAS